MSSRLTFTPEQISLINKIEYQLRDWMDVEGLAQWIAKDLPMYEIILFGSRMKGNHREDSDLDVIFHNPTCYGEWSDEAYCKQAHDDLLALCEIFKTYLNQSFRLDALLSHYGTKGEYMGVVNRDSQYIDRYEDITSGWDSGDIPYYFKINAQGLSFEVLDGCEDMVFDGDAFKSCY